MAIDRSIEEQLKAAKAARDATGPDGSATGAGGGPPYDSGLDKRVTTLESDMRDIRTTLTRLEVVSGRIEATLATKSDVIALSERIASLDGRTGRLEAAIADTVRSAVGKAIGPW